MYPLSQQGGVVLEGISLKSGEAKLAYAVLERAWKDACSNSDGYEARTARCFLCGYPSIWRSRLSLFCDILEIDDVNVMNIARKKWKPNLMKDKK